MATIRSALKSFFSNGKKPNEVQFHEWIDSFVHKEEDGIVIDPEENVGIGLDPRAKLHINGGLLLGDVVGNASDNALAGTLRRSGLDIQIKAVDRWISLVNGEVYQHFPINEKSVGSINMDRKFSILEGFSQLAKLRIRAILPAETEMQGVSLHGRITSEDGGSFANSFSISLPQSEGGDCDFQYPLHISLDGQSQEVTIVVDIRLLDGQNQEVPSDVSIHFLELSYDRPL